MSMLNWAFLPYDHSAVISDLYVLQEGQSIAIGDVVEFTTDPPTMVQSMGEGARYEVRRGCINFNDVDLEGTGPDDVVGFSFSDIGTTDTERGVAVLKHGFALATACDINGDIQPETPLKCCSIGQVQDMNNDALTLLAVLNFKIAKSITAIPMNRVGIVFKAD